jgi:hypothetical protein
MAARAGTLHILMVYAGIVDILTVCAGILHTGLGRATRAAICNWT